MAFATTGSSRAGKRHPSGSADLLPRRRVHLARAARLPCKARHAGPARTLARTVCAASSVAEGAVSDPATDWSCESEAAMLAARRCRGSRPLADNSSRATLLRRGGWSVAVALVRGEAAGSRKHSCESARQTAGWGAESAKADACGLTRFTSSHSSSASAFCCGAVRRSLARERGIPACLHP